MQACMHQTETRQAAATTTTTHMMQKRKKFKNDFQVPSRVQTDVPLV